MSHPASDDFCFLFGFKLNFFYITESFFKKALFISFVFFCSINKLYNIDIRKFFFFLKSVSALNFVCLGYLIIGCKER